MTSVSGKIYIGTILLEANRHKPGKIPTYRVSEWIERFRGDGFDGMELWENHAALAGPEELAAIGDADFPVAVYNTYAGFDDAGAENRRQAARLAGLLSAGGVKFNVGPDPALCETYVRSARRWRELIGEAPRLLCECHPGTVMETPDAAAGMFEQMGSQQFQAIVHAFTIPLGDLKSWFDRCGPRITHVHVQTRADGRTVGLAHDPSRARETLHLMREEGFAGSFTLEFTEGQSTDPAKIENSYKHALDDLGFLKEHLG